MSAAPLEPQRALLADGRELVLYEDTPRPPRRVGDARTLPARAAASEIRYDDVHDEYVIVAAHRQGRTHLPVSEDCPLCPTRPGHPTEIPTDDYGVAVFENRFPALGPYDLAADSGDHPAGGRCEVVCFSSDHTKRLFEFDRIRLQTVGRVWADRVAELSARGDVAYVFVFENSGRDIGITLEHPHGQIYGYPFVPPRVRQATETARRWRERRGGCLFCHVVAAEVATGERVVHASERFVAFVPYAARWPYEVHVYPRRHVADLTELTSVERDEAMEIYADVLRRFDQLFVEETAYIAAWHQAPVREDRDVAHLRLQVFTIRRAPGKLKYLAGSESALGAFVNDVVPEDAAARLRAAGSE